MIPSGLAVLERHSELKKQEELEMDSVQKDVCARVWRWGGTCTLGFIHT